MSVSVRLDGKCCKERAVGPEGRVSAEAEQRQDGG